MHRFRFRSLALSVCAVLSLVTGLEAQEANARLSGIITDSSKALIAGANVVAVNKDTNVRFPTRSNGSGVYVLPSLPIGEYRIEVEHTGFKSIVEASITLHTQDALELNFEMAVGSSTETVTVSGNNGTNDSPAVSMTVTREFIENMPLNGRSFQDLIQLAPGTVSSANQTGYYSVDGQRTDGNNFTVDGVSANLGGALNSAGQDGGISGNTPSQTALGTTQSLVSVDALQEFIIQTSGYSAEYGRNPGGQIAFTTRSGTNDIRGTLFEYLRNTAFDANSYDNDYYGFPQAPEHQNDFGGTFGGPLVIPKLYNGRDKTFFFVSYEALRLLTPAFEADYVPTQAFSDSASPAVQPYLNSSPMPSRNSPGNQDGCTIPDPSTGQPAACDALFTRSYSNPSQLDNVSLRLDQNLGHRFHSFVRYADTPSSADSAYEQQGFRSQITSHTWTLGLTANVSSPLLDELRFNYSYDGEGRFANQQSIGGAKPLARDLLVPSAYDSADAFGEFSVYVPGSSLYFSSEYQGSGSVQHQYQFIDSLSWTRGKHNVKFGGDWRRLTPTASPFTYQSQIQLRSLTSVEQGYATSLTIQAAAPGQPVFDNFSLYAQDHWKIRSKLSIDYGMRWEFNPPPGPSNGHYPVTLTSSDLATATVAPLGTVPYKTTYDHFAPRVGFAWNAIPSVQHPLTLRGGFGIFFDTGQQTIGAAYFGAYPFFAITPTLSNVSFPLSDAVLAPPSLNVPLTPPYPTLNEVTSPSLTLPYTEQWNLSLDEALNSKNTLTVSYVGNEGKKLLFTGYYQGGAGYPINPDFANGVNFTYNGSSSNYNALQVQDRGRITNGLDFVGSFTWVHSLDNASSNYGGFPAPLYGNSDNDLRRALNLALNYQMPTVGSSGLERALSGGWVIANRFSTQSGYALNVYQAQYVPLPSGGYQDYVPDLVPGDPIYLHGRLADEGGQPVPGSWRLNSAAFALVSTDPATGLPVRQGTLGRNYLRGPGFYTLNTAVQRSLPLHEQLNLVFRVEAFNTFNHPNLDFPDVNLPDSTFGELQPNNGVRTIGVPNQLYAMGAARSLQLSLKLQF